MYRIAIEDTDIANELAIKSRGNGAHIGNAVPNDIAYNMIALIPDEWFKPKGNELTDKELYITNHRVLDLSCNSGMLLVKFLRKFESCLKDSYLDWKNDDECSEFIIKNLLYGICLDSNLCTKIRGILYNNSSVHGNIYNYDIFGGTYTGDVNLVIENNKVKIYDSNRKERVDMKFDVVCGNPPYTKDMYLEFVQLGHRLSNQYSLWITPSKFWAKDTEVRDTEFRDLIKKSGDTFVVYKDCKEIFPSISEPGGIAYYILSHNKVKEGFDIECHHKTSIAFQSVMEHHTDLDFLPLKTVDILHKFGESDFKNKLNHKVSYFVEHTFDGGININLPISVYNGKTLFGNTSEDSLLSKEGLDKYKCIQAHTCGSSAFQSDDEGKFLGLAPIYILKPYEVGRGFHHLKFFDTVEEANNFVTFMQTKVVNFTYICGVVGTCNSREFYRYIPDIDDFTIIYEDRPLNGYTPDRYGEYIDRDGNKHCSLYVKYKLTDDEIKVIESVIRERK